MRQRLPDPAALTAAPGASLGRLHSILRFGMTVWVSLTVVLTLAGIGLIFTRSQERTQPGWLTQTGQTNRVFDAVCSHAQFRGGELPGGEVNHRREACWALGGERVALCIPLVLYSLSISIIAVSVCVLCCSVKLSLF